MRGEVIEIVGRLSSGRTSLLTAWLTDVTRRGGFVALVDADGAFDPSSAVRAGVDLRRLLWVRTGSRRDTALRAVDLLVRCRGLALVAVDLGESPPRLSLAAAFRWRMAVQRAGTTLVILTARRIAGAGATLAVRTARRALEWSGDPRPTREARVASAQHALLTAALGVSPRVEDAGPGLAYVEIHGLGRLVGDDRAVGERLVRLARDVGLEARVGIADGRTAARVASYGDVRV